MAAFALAVAGCDVPSPPSRDDGDVGPEDDPQPVLEASVHVVDEDGADVASATYRVEDGAVSGAAGTNAARAGVERPVDGTGRFRLDALSGPTLVVIEAPGHLAEPIVLGGPPASGEVNVRLWRSSGAGGRRRIALHFGGDTMLGRRYVTPVSELTARVTPGDGGASARAVVSALAPLFRAASLRSLNLETVVGELPQSAAYPKKRFLLQSPPETTALLDELGTNLCTLGNNHARDWLDEGVASTVDALNAAGIPHVGAGVTPEEAAAPLIVDLGGYRFGHLSYTSVNGDFVNDSLPLNSAPRPSPLPATEAWQYDMRTFEYLGATLVVPRAQRRIGEFWSLFEDLDTSGASDAERDDLWERAIDIYPELQDWVARRGHGGANPYDSDRIEDDIGELRAAGCDLVVVQFHSGFQFFEVKSEHLESSVHRAVDAGADLVVCHHPHVLQGFEHYQGKLIAYSLGNFIFDQDFLSTFNTVVLRVVFEEADVIEARVYPLVLERYRPLPLTGNAAARVVQILHERSILPFRSERIDGGIRTVRRDVPVGVTPIKMTWDGGSGLIEAGAASTATEEVTLDTERIADLAPPALTRSRGPGGVDLDDILLGRDLFRWGDFEDEMADGEARGGPHWLVNTSTRRIEATLSAPSGYRCLRLRRTASSTQRVLVRPVARIPRAEHRMWAEDDGELTPLDGEASYTLRLNVRLSGGGDPHVRFDVYHFDDSNPTEDPESSLLRSHEEPLQVPGDDAWHAIVMDVPEIVFSPAGELPANALLLNFGLRPPRSGESIFRADDVQLLEWREAASLPDGFYALDAVRGAAARAGAGDTVELERTEP